MEHKNVLLLGNGINLAFGGIGWSKVISTISKRKDFDVDKLTLPMPLQAVLMTNDSVDCSLKDQKNKDIFWGEVQNDEQLNILQELLIMGFDDIITTNYSYELESAALSCRKVTENKLKKMSKSTEEKVEPKYLLHSYNEVSYSDQNNRIWHIHGEARKPNSMILGHYWYGNLLARMKNEIDASGNDYAVRQQKNLDIKYDSWIDSFLLGNVYVLGFGYSTSELDLWWLLNRRKREKATKGNIYFYEMHNSKDEEKIELLKLFNAKVEDFNMTAPSREDPECNLIYKDFYKKSIKDIRVKIGGDNEV